MFKNELFHIFRNFLVLVSVTALLSSCSSINPFHSKAYKAGVSAGKELNKLQDTTDTIASWAKAFGADQDSVDQVTGQENCENICLLSGLLAYHLKNTESNHKDFIAGCESVFKGGA